MKGKRAVVLSASVVAATLSTLATGLWLTPGSGFSATGLAAPGTLQLDQMLPPDDQAIDWGVFRLIPTGIADPVLARPETRSFPAR
jgi:hypothetical protein